MTKQEKIKEAYGEDYKFINEFLIGNGFFDGECDDFIHLRRKLYKNGGIDIKIIDEVQFVRPKSLQGIENNNGWKKIESEDDLPKETDLYWAIDEEFGTDICEFHSLPKKWYCGDVEYFVSHYKPIEKPKPPLY